jgi:2'-5' RNA ligase
MERKGMTLPSVIRVFFAIELPLFAKEKVDQFIGALKKKSKTHSIRWTKLENLHVTLQFIGEAHSADMPRLIENVRARIAGKVTKLTLSIGRLRLFPNSYRPRVIVLDIAPQDELTILSGLIGSGIKMTNYEIEKRPFRGHLTLGRIKQPRNLNLRFLSEFAAPEIEKIDLNEVVLFRSEPQPEGSRYIVVDKIIFI